jgi:hypothetical protein
MIEVTICGRFTFDDANKYQNIIERSNEEIYWYSTCARYLLNLAVYIYCAFWIFSGRKLYIVQALPGCNRFLSLTHLCGSGSNCR